MRRPSLTARLLVAAVFTSVSIAAASASAGPATVLPTLSPAAPSPTAAAVAAAVAPALADASLGRDSDGEVLDALTGAVLWSHDPTTPQLVASTQKLAVATAALTVLGAGTRPTTSVYGVGTRAGGVFHGALYLRGGGDPLLTATANSAWPMTTSLATLAADVAATGMTTVTGGLVADSTAFTGPTSAPGWRTDYLTEGSVAPVTALALHDVSADPSGDRSADPVPIAAAAFAADLARDGVHVAGATSFGGTPNGATRVAAVAGAPIAVDLTEMLSDSDNNTAETLGRLLALALGRPGTFAGAAAAITATLTRLGVPTTGLALVDASGLSRDDRVPPTVLAALLRLAAGPVGAGGDATARPILADLPVAAFSGTLAGRYRTGAAAAGAGLVRAKTGNLDGVTAEAGTVVDTDGRQLLFVFVSDTSGNRNLAEAALDRAAAALVAL